MPRTVRDGPPCEEIALNLATDDNLSSRTLAEEAGVTRTHARRVINFLRVEGLVKQIATDAEGVCRPWKVFGLGMEEI